MVSTTTHFLLGALRSREVSYQGRWEFLTESLEQSLCCNCSGHSQKTAFRAVNQTAVQTDRQRVFSHLYKVLFQGPVDPSPSETLSTFQKGSESFFPAQSLRGGCQEKEKAARDRLSFLQLKLHIRVSSKGISSCGGWGQTLKGERIPQRKGPERMKGS